MVPGPPSTAALPLPRERRGAGRTSEAILDAAAELFAERGFEGTSLRDVAERVGVRAPSLYNHFPSKQSLYAAVLERGLGPVLELLAVAAQSGSELDRSRVVADVMAVLARHPHLPRLLLHETLAGGERLTPMLQRWIAPAFARAEALIEADPAARRWKAEQIPLLVLALYHVVVGYFTTAGLYRDLRGEDLLSEEALGRQTRFLAELVAALFAADTEPGSR